MSGNSRPKGRECAVAHAALTAIREEETRESEMTAGPVLALAPVLRGAQQSAIRLIDLERRARFARHALETH